MNELSGEYSGLYWCAISACASFCEGKTERIFGIYSLWDVLLSPGRLCNQFFYGNLCADALVTSVEITPVCEEILKFLPFLLWLLIFEPQQEEILSAAMFIAIGFATFENICYLAENGAQNFYFLFLRGIAAGAMHLCGGIAAGYGIGFVFQRLWLRVIGTIGILGFCIVFHGIYNLLVTAGGTWQRCGYLFPVICIMLVYIIRLLRNHLQRNP